LVGGAVLAEVVFADLAIWAVLGRFAVSRFFLALPVYALHPRAAVLVFPALLALSSNAPLSRLAVGVLRTCSRLLGATRNGQGKESTNKDQREVKA
jgi:hypothetical protein